MDKFEKLIFIIALAVNLMFNPARIYAQQYEPCNPQNPNYCTECRDENARDFAKCGEIDYTKYATEELDRLGRVIKFPNSFVDYDPYKKKIMMSINIGSKNQKIELFILRGGESYLDKKTNEIVINFLAGKSERARITYSPENVCNVKPFWTAQRAIAYQIIDHNVNSENTYLINENGSNRREISFEDGEYRRLFEESHRWNAAKKDAQNLRVDVPPQ